MGTGSSDKTSTANQQPRTPDPDRDVAMLFVHLERDPWWDATGTVSPRNLRARYEHRFPQWGETEAANPTLTWFFGTALQCAETAGDSVWQARLCAAAGTQQEADILRAITDVSPITELHKAVVRKISLGEPPTRALFDALRVVLSSPTKLALLATATTLDHRSVIRLGPSGTLGASRRPLDSR